MRIVNYSAISRRFDKFKHIGREIFIITFSVFIAFLADRLYERYEERKDLHEALNAYYQEAKADIIQSDDRIRYEMLMTIDTLKKYEFDTTKSLSDLDKRKTLKHFFGFNIGLSYIEKNVHLRFDPELQPLVSRMLGVTHEQENYGRVIRNMRISEDFFYKDERSIIAKQKAIALYEETSKRFESVRSDFLELEQMLKKKGIVE